MGVLIYGIAEASTAFLITKVTEPPPPPEHLKEYVESEVHWKNKHEFLKLPLDKLDALNIKASNSEEATPAESEVRGRKFT